MFPAGTVPSPRPMPPAARPPGVRSGPRREPWHPTSAAALPWICRLPTPGGLFRPCRTSVANVRRPQILSFLSRKMQFADLLQIAPLLNQPIGTIRMIQQLPVKDAVERRERRCISMHSCGKTSQMEHLVLSQSSCWLRFQCAASPASFLAGRLLQSRTSLLALEALPSSW